MVRAYNVPSGPAAERLLREAAERFAWPLTCELDSFDPDDNVENYEPGVDGDDVLTICVSKLRAFPALSRAHAFFSAGQTEASVQQFAESELDNRQGHCARTECAGLCDRDGNVQDRAREADSRGRCCCHHRKG